jgi:hypothetical protein
VPRVPSDQIRQTLDCLITKNALSYQYFLESLILTQNIDIANLLEPDYSTSEACKMMIDRERITLPTSNQSSINLSQPGHLTKNFSFPVACNSSSNQSNSLNPSYSGFQTPLQVQRQMRHNNMPYHVIF